MSLRTARPLPAYQDIFTLLLLHAEMASGGGGAQPSIEPLTFPVRYVVVVTKKTPPSAFDIEQRCGNITGFGKNGKGIFETPLGEKTAPSGACKAWVQANTSCSQESTHSHECAPFLSDQFAICACMCCVFSPPACAHHAVPYASLFPPPLPAFPTTLAPSPHCTGLL